MINAKKLMSQSRLLSITEAKESREAVEAFLGTTVSVIPFARYADEFHKVADRRRGAAVDRPGSPAAPRRCAA